MSEAPEFRPLGVDGILVRFARVLTKEANAQALGFRDAVEAATIAGVVEIASSLTSVRVAFDPVKTDRATLLAQLQKVAASLDVESTGPKRIWHIPVCFAPEYAPQLAEAANLAGQTEQQAIADITGRTVRVIAIGFAPGQPYLGMLPAHWDIPRQSALTESLPHGALIVAVRQLIIWAAEAPTGWRHIGQSAFQVYRPGAPDPFAFAPGDAVRFHQVGQTEMAGFAANPDPDGGGKCEVLM